MKLWENPGNIFLIFSNLVQTLIEDPVLLFHFFQGLQKDHKQMLHTMSRGSFFRIPTDEARVM